MNISGNIVDVLHRRIFPGTLVIEKGEITEIREEPVNTTVFILPGFIDAHVHIESSMLIPSEFARLAVVHGTVATVSDPHEIANVLGIDGVRFMIENGKKVPFHFFFGAPSCVPATPFETSGARLGLSETETLLRSEDIWYLSEMMNFPGVLHGDGEVLAKLRLARQYGKKTDGHAPGLRGDDAKLYARAGITTDHECFSYEEAADKIRAGMKILIREGSAARNFEALIPLISEFPDQIMFCSDDKHPDDLVGGHINLLAKRAVDMGYDWMSVVRACSLVPVQHYGLPVGLLQTGDQADFVVVDSLTEMHVMETWIRGIRVASGGKSLISSVVETPVNLFLTAGLQAEDLLVPAEGNSIKVQKAIDGQLLTEVLTCEARVEQGYIQSDPDRDILKMIVLNRYHEAKPAIGFVNGFGLSKGAIASTVAHDSHNIIAVGVSDEDILEAVRLLISAKGGVSLASGEEKLLLPLPVAGLMSDADGYQVASRYQELDAGAKNLGSSLRSPYMTLSFMALLVIPALKLSDKGLFDGTVFHFTDLNVRD
ncbi:MAG TPA: adenine deaminase [Bacteroidales bacterium]|nr:adenine deaminase [Bacteroidales bacterium]HSA43074.1 adenine deaminase [Bacteroidales bacterium]